MASSLVFSVQKALTILDILIFEDVDKKGLRLSEISKKTDIKANTLHNLLKTMIVQNYVQQYKNGNYAIGIKIDRICILRQINHEQYEHGTLDFLEALKEDIKENVIFTVLSSGKWKQVKELVYESPIQVNYSKIVQTSIYSKATGRVLVSYCSQQELEEIINMHGMPEEKWDDIKTIEQLQQKRESIREKGYYDLYTQNDQLWAIGIPALNHSGDIIGSIGCAAPAFRCNEEKKRYIRERFIEVASEIRNYMF